MALDLGVESLLGTSDDDGSPGLRDRLALATRYLANWYKATSSSDNKDVWWQKIDTVRAKVEATYNELLQPLNSGFLSRQAKADYDDASASWADLWRQLQTSDDTIDVSLLSQLADFGTTLIQAPGLIIPQITDSLGKALGDGTARFFAAAWPFLIGAGVALGVYVFRRPLAALVSKGVG